MIPWESVILNPSFINLINSVSSEPVQSDSKNNKLVSIFCSCFKQNINQVKSL